jgi:hypothetical protein
VVDLLEVIVFGFNMRELIEKYNAKTFLTSNNALKMLQKVVAANSAIAQKIIFF